MDQNLPLTWKTSTRSHGPLSIEQTHPDLVERVGHPGDDVEPVQYAFGVRAALGDARVDPAGPVAGDDLDGGALFGRLCFVKLE